MTTLLNINADAYYRISSRGISARGCHTATLFLCMQRLALGLETFVPATEIDTYRPHVTLDLIQAAQDSGALDCVYDTVDGRTSWAKSMPWFNLSELFTQIERRATPAAQYEFYMLVHNAIHNGSN